MAESPSDQMQLCRVLSTMGYAHWMLGNQNRIAQLNQRAHAIAASLGDFAIEAAACCAAYREGTEVLQRSMSLQPMADQTFVCSVATQHWPSICNAKLYRWI